MSRPQPGDVAAAPDSHEVPDEHAEAFHEMCDQICKVVLREYADMQRITIFRELPPSLQLNAVAVGAIVGGLIPTMANCHEDDDVEIAKGLLLRLPDVIRLAREKANAIMKVKR